MILTPAGIVTQQTREATRQTVVNADGIFVSLVVRARLTARR